MSINFHAYQSRGYLFENYEAQCEQWRSRFTKYDPDRVSQILNLKYDDTYLYIVYYHQNFRLCLENGILEKQKDENWTDQIFFNETMSIYHLLYYVQDEPGNSGSWIPNEQLDSRRKSGKVNDILLESFSKRFAGHCAELEAACKKLRGIPAGKGDVAYEFESFPQVKIRMTFWDEDDEFPAQTQIFVDSRVTDYVHFETTGCMVSDLLELLEEGWINKKE